MNLANLLREDPNPLDIYFFRSVRQFWTIVCERSLKIEFFRLVWRFCHNISRLFLNIGLKFVQVLQTDAVYFWHAFFRKILKMKLFRAVFCQFDVLYTGWWVKRNLYHAPDWWRNLVDCLLQFACAHKISNLFATFFSVKNSTISAFSSVFLLLLQINL